MKFATFSVIGEPERRMRVGLVSDSYVIDLNVAAAGMLASEQGDESIYQNADKSLPQNMLGVLQNFGNILELAKQILERSRSADPILGPRGEQVRFGFDKIKLHSPLPCPLSIRDFLCFQKHMENSYSRLSIKIPEMWFKIPAYYRANPTTVIGPDDDITWPSFSDKLDYEFEIAMYIAKTGTNIDNDSSALNYIAGFSILNDVSARDRQHTQMLIGMGPGKGKDFNGSKVLGPYIVTGDEIDFKHMRCTIRINGKKVMEGTPSEMYWSWEDLLAYISQDETIYPGEVFGSGTIPYGCALENDAWPEPGDVIELEAKGLGVLKNRFTRKSYLKPWKEEY